MTILPVKKQKQYKKLANKTQQTPSFLYFNLIYLFQQMLSYHGMVNDFDLLIFKLYLCTLLFMDMVE